MTGYQAESISFKYRVTPVLSNISLTLDHNGAVALLGPNGSGKTTLLKLLLGLLTPTDGRVMLDGQAITNLSYRARSQRVAYVPQIHRETFGYLVKEVVLMGRMPHSGFLGRYGAKDRQLAEAAMERMAIGHLANRPYNEISGGERQMTLIARALAQDTKILVLDEPTNGLDYGNQHRLLKRIITLKEQGYLCLFTTHHPDHARMVADRVIMVSQGNIIRDGPPDQVITPTAIAELYGIPPEEHHHTICKGGASWCPSV